MSYLVFVSLIWGFSFIIIKGSLTPLDSSFVSFARLLLSLVLFLPFIRRARLKLSEILQLMAIGGVQFGLMYLAYIAAFRDLPAHVVALLTTTTPVFVSIFSGLYEKRLDGIIWLAVLLAVAGGAILEFPGQPLAASARGVVLIQLSNAAFAFGQVAYRNWMARRTALDDISIFAFPYAGAVVVTGLFSLLLTDFSRISVQPQQWAALLYLGVIASGASFFLWNKGAREVQAGTLAVMNNMKIPVAVAASFALLGERTSWVSLLTGCALIAAALYLNYGRQPAAGSRR